MRKYTKRLVPLAFFIGFFIGILPSTNAQGSPPYFAGYNRSLEVKGVRADIGYKNPSVSHVFSTEWVMLGENNNTNYLQVGWIKEVGDPGPKFFWERGPFQCPDIPCRGELEPVPSGTTHSFEVSIRYTCCGPHWRAYIDGQYRYDGPDTVIGFGQSASRAYWIGETRDTRDQLGGTPTSHLRFSTVKIKPLSNSTWVTPATSLLVTETTPSTPYRATRPGSGGANWIDNWTE